MATGIKFVFTAQRFEAVCELYKVWNNYYIPNNAHEQLLYCHLQALHRRLLVMEISSQAKYTFTLNEVEAMAFMQLWPQIDLTDNMYNDMVIREMIATIDKKSKQPKTITHGTHTR